MGETMSEPTNTGDALEPVFEVEYECRNCGGSFSIRYERQIHVEQTDSGVAVNDGGTFQSASKVTCVVCELEKCLSVRDRTPVDSEDAA